MLVIDGRNISNIHYKWARDLNPVAVVDPNEIFEVITPDSSIMQIRKDYDKNDLGEIDKNRFDGAVGPIFVRGAKPGDSIEIEIMDIEVDDWGWSAVFKDFGLLKGEFDDDLIIWQISEGYAKTNSDFLKGIKIPVDPFLGVIGVAPKEGIYDMIPPQYFGGNIDNKYLTRKNSKLILPVFVEGALISIGDPHASQGDGEVCGTAIETSARVKLKINILKNEYFFVGESKLKQNSEIIITTGIDDDLYRASKMAVKNMINFLEKYQFTPKEAYVLCSVIGDLKISEIVDEPNFVVSCILPKNVVMQKLY